jgi:recombinational DNA repair protein (RecF pathway)
MTPETTTCRPMDTQLTTRFLVLRKTPYSESSLVVAGVSPDAGQIHFLVRGARKLGKRQFPAADLFQVLAVQYRHGRGSLCTWQAAEPEADYRAAAASPARFEAACRLAKFTLANVREGLAQPRHFAALQLALARLADPAAAETDAVAAAFVGTALVFLDEHGLLPDYPDNERLERQRDWLLRAAETPGPAPVLPAADWRRLEAWLEALLRHHDCRV